MLCRLVELYANAAEPDSTPRYTVKTCITSHDALATFSRTAPSVTFAGSPRLPHRPATTSTSTAVGSAPGRTGMRTDSRPLTVPMVGTHGLGTCAARRVNNV